MFFYWQKRHSNAVRTWQRQLESEFHAFASVEIMRNLNQHTCAVAGLGIAPTCAAVRQIQQHLDAVANDAMALFAANAGHESNPAGIVLLGRIVQTLRGRHAIYMSDAGHRDFSPGDEFAIADRWFLDSSQGCGRSPHPLQTYSVDS